MGMEHLLWLNFKSRNNNNNNKLGVRLDNTRMTTYQNQ